MEGRRTMIKRKWRGRKSAATESIRRGYKSRLRGAKKDKENDSSHWGGW